MQIFTSTGDVSLELDREKSDGQQLAFALKPMRKRLGSQDRERASSQISAPGIDDMAASASRGERQLKPMASQARDAVMLHPVAALLMYQQPLQLNERYQIFQKMFRTPKPPTNSRNLFYI